MEVNIDDHKPPNLDKVWEDAFYQVRSTGGCSCHSCSSHGCSCHGFIHSPVSEVARNTVILIAFGGTVNVSTAGFYTVGVTDRLCNVWLLSACSM